MSPYSFKDAWIELCQIHVPLVVVGDTYDEFLQKLLEAEANKQNRYAVFDFHYTKVTLDTTLEKDKLMYINWYVTSRAVTLEVYKRCLAMPIWRSSYTVILEKSQLMFLTR